MARIVWTALTGLNMRTTRKKTSDYLYSLKSAKAAAKNAALSAIFAAASGAPADWFRRPEQ